MSVSSAQTSLTDPQQIAIFNDVSGKLICQCGCNMMVSVCNHINCPSAIPLRGEIESAIRVGKSSGEVLSQLTAQHGSQVLAAPAFEGWGRVAWLAPGVVLVIAIAVAAARLASWVRKPEASPWK